MLPGSSASYDNQRITIAYFAISGLDILDRLNLIDDMREDIIGWVYNLLINHDTDDTSRCGFREAPIKKISGYVWKPGGGVVVNNLCNLFLSTVKMQNILNHKISKIFFPKLFFFKIRHMK